jgi:hypothetical protein
MSCVISLKGRLIPIIDLRTRFGMDRSERNKNTRIVVTGIWQQAHNGVAPWGATLDDKRRDFGTGSDILNARAYGACHQTAHCVDAFGPCRDKVSRARMVARSACIGAVRCRMGSSSCGLKRANTLKTRPSFSRRFQ